MPKLHDDLNDCPWVATGSPITYMHATTYAHLCRSRCQVPFLLYTKPALYIILFENVETGILGRLGRSCAAYHNLFIMVVLVFLARTRYKTQGLMRQRNKQGGRTSPRGRIQAQLPRGLSHPGASQSMAARNGRTGGRRGLHDGNQSGAG